MLAGLMIANFRFPISDFMSAGKGNLQLAIGNRQSAIKKATDSVDAPAPPFYARADSHE
jgi:hypothetical protein